MTSEAERQTAPVTPDAYPVPEPSVDDPGLTGRELAGRPARFLNRELSWIAFNRRVLEEARNARHPLLERLRFLSIAAANQEEFFMVRVAGLKHQLKQGVIEPSPDGLSAQEQLDLVDGETAAFAKDLQATWSELRDALAAEDVTIAKVADLAQGEKDKAADILLSEIHPVLTPVAVDGSHPFPFIANKGMALALELKDPGQKKDLKCLIVLPASLPRFFRLPGSAAKFLAIEDLIVSHIDRLLPSAMAVQSYTVFRVLRDSELEIDDEADDLVRTFETALRRRKRSSIVRLTVQENAPPRLLEFIAGNLDVKKHNVLFFDMVGMAHLRELVSGGKPALLFPAFEPRYPSRIKDFEGDCFAAIKHKDFVVHHPYESFDVVVHFLDQAARDPDVVSIKQTIYRTSSQSPIVQALILAAENGKSVTALVELKARFDEEANLRWARDMEKAGIQVIFGIKKLKIHAKLSIVTRREGRKMTTYAHFGTGNYHSETARAYSDLSLFSCDATLCRDALAFFNYMTVYAVPQTLEKLSFAPGTMRQTLKALIQTETENAKKGLPAQIWMKCNALTDPDMIDLLYRASQAGVDIDLVVRGICVLRPGIRGLSEKIRVWSMVGRYLEHARIFCFANGNDMPSSQARVFMTSADLMQRNLDRRIEVMVEISDATVHKQILEQVMVANLKDQRQSWLMQPDGTYLRIPADDSAFSAQDYFMKNSSLSGRGKALSQAPMPPALVLDRHKKK